MNNIHIKPHIPEVEYGFTLPSSDSSVSVTILLLHSLPALSLAALLAVAVFHISSNEGGHLRLLRWGAGTELLSLTYSSGLPTDSIITSTDKYAVFPSFSDTTTFLTSSVPSYSSDTFSLASSAAIFDTCGNKGGDE